MLNLAKKLKTLNLLNLVLAKFMHINVSSVLILSGCLVSGLPNSVCGSKLSLWKSNDSFFSLTPRGANRTLKY